MFRFLWICFNDVHSLVLPVEILVRALHPFCKINARDVVQSDVNVFGVKAQQFIPHPTTRHTHRGSGVMFLLHHMEQMKEAPFFLGQRFEELRFVWESGGGVRGGGVRGGVRGERSGGVRGGGKGGQKVMERSGRPLWF